MQLWFEYVDLRTQSDSHTPHTALRNTGASLVWSYEHPGIGQPAQLLEETFYDHEKNLIFSKLLKRQSPHLPWNNSTLSSIIHFIAYAAQQSMIIRWGMIEAGALAVILIAFVDGVPMLSNAVDTFRYPRSDLQSTLGTSSESKERTRSTYTCISVSLLGRVASDLLDAAQTPVFRALLQTEIFNQRRSTCVYLWDTLLGPRGDVDDMYTEIRDVFEQILL
jgi:hypothetical protein